MLGANFLRNLLPRRSSPVRFVVSTKAENLLVQRKAADVRLELAIYAATTTPEQRERETAEFFARAAARHAIRKRSRKARERGAVGQGAV